MGSAAEDFSNVETQFAYVGSSFAANFEENISSFHFEKIYVVDFAGSQLAFYRGTDRRSLINSVFEFR